jgi:tRNA (cytidine/uridine-2'-O-)-methyltransferase
MNTRSRQLHVVLVEPEIHWNTGNAGRTCLAAGAQLHLVEPLGFSLGAREVRRAGLDYWPSVKPRVWPTWSSFETELPSMGNSFFFSPAATRTLWDVTLASPCVLVFGSETRGLPSKILADHASQLVRIPQARDSVRALNLSTAVGIAVYEALRQAR